MSLFVNLSGLARRTLPPNRFRRGLRFAASGLGIGLLLTVAFSVLRVFPLPSVAWWPLVRHPDRHRLRRRLPRARRAEDGIDEEELDDLRELDETLAAVAAVAADDDAGAGAGDGAAERDTGTDTR